MRGAGLRLLVNNQTDSSLCFLPSSLTANSGSLRAYANGKEITSPNNAEYPENISGTGPFYLASSDSVTGIPIDEGGLDLPDGKYIFSLRPAWADCKALDSRRAYDPAKFRVELVRSAVDYRLFK
jgi:hypothetical protein